MVVIAVRMCAPPLQVALVACFSARVFHSPVFYSVQCYTSEERETKARNHSNSNNNKDDEKVV